ncbi:hypothetical protein QO010_001527 [Caulobacter ginsengisoli]|uniref:Uncharacterized protein n=1 Tax=Caulobacter ginsengisoli TaxID=400775 RepID=A0ABU0IQX7_9CAUL|nr:hypothetical protein [Caulobacter ginsengisoli]MDQ0463756.1 hypothetical protein [Caulobacter ginsengisoli]
MIGRRALLVAGFSLAVLGRARAQSEDPPSESDNWPTEYEVFGLKPLAPNDEVVRAYGGFRVLQLSRGWWTVEARALPGGRTEIQTQRAVRDRRLYDRTATISLPEYRRLKARALAFYQAEKADEAEQALARSKPPAPGAENEGTVVGAVCLDADYANAEIGAVPGEAGPVWMGSTCFENTDAAGSIGHMLLAAARLHAP